MKKIKKNVLKPLLFICLGLTITTFVFASMRIAERPDPPRNPEIFSIWSNGCTLGWEAPRFDGGSRIVSYEIESQGYYSFKWVNKGSTRDLVHEITGMTEGSEARFRITASNAFGKSDPVTTDYVTFKKRQ